MNRVFFAALSVQKLTIAQLWILVMIVIATVLKLIVVAVQGILIVAVQRKKVMLMYVVTDSDNNDTIIDR